MDTATKLFSEVSISVFFFANESCYFVRTSHRSVHIHLTSASFGERNSSFRVRISRRRFIRFKWLRCQNLILRINIQNIKIFKQWNKLLLFHALSNGSTFLGHPRISERFVTGTDI